MVILSESETYGSFPGLFFWKATSVQGSKSRELWLFDQASTPLHIHMPKTCHSPTHLK